MSTPIYDALNEKLTIEALDWEHVPACESFWCEGLPPHEADVFAGKTCGCTRYMCSESLETPAAPGWFRCPSCHQDHELFTSTASGFFAWIRPINK